MDKVGELSKMLKVLSEPIRLQIIDMLSCEEMCGCNILEGLSISQSTLSHHMKVLKDCNLVKVRKDATWVYYSINRERFKRLHLLIDEISKEKENCVCKIDIKKC